ncbi:Sucrase/ferredoxin-like-domain-containing protein [Irpex rosettiformis]|uniref:Sucrase/ferredoxin-like-domain-containing protein n=1 Tax=Irpex rosettiformis TaxID=378272 RepID=A0ACB8UCM2_9APHY|nr:Sucrase/ferredoxin-like-domain-containing protein [Irpex rosettiformis]
MFASLRSVKAAVLGHNTNINATATLLKEGHVPISEDPCRGCADPCDEGHDEYPARFDIDMETQLLGSMKPFARQLVVSTGKTDWAHDVTSVFGSGAHYLDATSSSAHTSHLPPQLQHPQEKPILGVHPTSEGKKTTVLNGSHYSISSDQNKDTVLVLPDYKVVAEVERSSDGAKAFWEDLLSEKGVENKSNVLPYACVILLCSHKKRDNRCHIAAPKLEHGLTAALERRNWEVHSQLSEYDFVQKVEGDDAEAAYLAQLKNAAQSKRALILKISHIGGHKFAGNVIIYTPTGASIWYGRVTPHHTEAIVRDTILGGKIIPELLRGGMNLTREDGKKTLNDW